MIGDVTQREQKNQSQQQPQAFFIQYFINCVFAADDNSYVSIAAQRDEKRDKKSSECPNKTVLQVILNVFTGGGMKAFLSIVLQFLCSVDFECSPVTIPQLK